MTELGTAGREGSVRDPTERRDQEAALRDAALPRDALDAMLEGCQVIGFDWRYLYVNDALAKQGRRAKEELLGRTMMECYPGIEHTAVFAGLRQCMEERRPLAMDNEFTFPDGARVVFELRIVPVPQGICIFSLDATERRHRLAAIVEDSDDAIVSTTLDGLVTTWNGAAERILGYTRAEMLGQPVSVLVPPQLASEVAARWARVMSGERIGHFLTTRVAKGGARIDVSATLSPVRDATGALVGTSQTLRDMRELRRAQEALERARDDAEAANRELESFSYSVAHDLRAPLRAIDGFSQALLEDLGPSLSAEHGRYLGLVRSAAQNMAELIDDMLALSRVSRQELRRESVSLTSLAREILTRLAQQAPTRTVRVEVADGLTAWADPKLVRIALENLLGNAWKFTGKRAEALVEVGVETTDGEPTYFVRDDGAGFDMNYAHKLFGVFARLHPASEFEGTGVGLATVQRVVSRHRGRVWAEGAPGRGACFRFTLGEGPWRRTGSTFGGDPT